MIRLPNVTFRQGADLRDRLLLLDEDGAAVDLSGLSDLEYRLNPSGGGGTSTVAKKSTTADRSFPGGGSGSDGEIVFIVLRAVLDVLVPGAFDLEVVSVPATGQRIVEAAGVVEIEAART